MVFEDRRGFWRDAFAWHGSATPLIMPYVIAFGLIATVIVVASWVIEHRFQLTIGLEVAPFEIAGAALGLLLILRTNAGYDRWWEARKLWGGIVNESRNLIRGARVHLAEEPELLHRLVRWTAVFPWSAMNELRGVDGLGPYSDRVPEADRVAVIRAQHTPVAVAQAMTECLAVARQRVQR
ncbi:MAG: hypothetical protein B7Z55_09315, partial [Planctomycetales bacterium 12-60-4]